MDKQTKCTVHLLLYIMDTENWWYYILPIILVCTSVDTHFSLSIFTDIVFGIIPFLSGVDKSFVTWKSIGLHVHRISSLCLIEKSSTQTIKNLGHMKPGPLDLKCVISCMHMSCWLIRSLKMFMPITIIIVLLYSIEIYMLNTLKLL